MIEHDIEAEQLEAQAVFDVVRLTRPVQMMHMRLGQAHCLDYDLIDLILNPLLGHQAVILRELLQDELIAALRTNVICVLILVSHEIVRVLIDGVVGQVHAEVLEV